MSGQTCEIDGNLKRGMAEMMWSHLLATPTPTPSSPFLATSSTTSNLVAPPSLKVIPSNPLHYYTRFVHSRGSTLLQLRTSNRRLQASLQDLQNDSSAIHNQEVEESIKAVKNAAKTRKVDKNQVLSALSVIEKARLDPSKFLETLGGTQSPGRTWMLIFTAEKKLKGGRYFPLTAVQRFDAEAKRIENGVYLGPLGSLTFEGRFSWKNRVLAFVFESIRIKFGPFSPLQISLGNQDNRVPNNNKDPFFIWFYVDEEIAVARGRSGGTAFWCRCRQVTAQ